jgi:hypothetical protein
VERLVGRGVGKVKMVEKVEKVEKVEVNEQQLAEVKEKIKNSNPFFFFLI